MKIFIERAHKKNINELHDLYSFVIKDNFIFEGYNYDTEKEEIEKEIKMQYSFLDTDFRTNGSEAYHLIAKHNNKIVGSFAHGTVTKIITDNCVLDLRNTREIRASFILPQYQRKGIGTLLLNAILLSLNQKKTCTICLYSGYVKGQKFWKKKIGKPTVILKKYWEPNVDCMIWKRKLSDLPIKYGI